jgi:general secretion pathway protein L
LVRLARVNLPKVSPAQLPVALLYALEDQLAGEPETHHVAPGARGADGSIAVAIVSKAWLAETAALFDRQGIRLSRLVPESCLPARGPGEWVWVDATPGGFVLTEEGASFAVDSSDVNLPAPLALALDAQALHKGGTTTVRCYAAPQRHDVIRSALSAHGAVAFESSWDWRNTSPATMAAAINLLCGEFSPRAEASPSERWQRFRPALWLACTALAVQVLASVIEWSALELRNWRLHREMRGIYAATFPDAPLAGPVDREFARRYAQATHARGELAPDDALPLLAHAAPLLRQAGLPDWRALAYAQSFVTIEFPRLSTAKVHELQIALRAVGVSCVAADFDGGTRVRLGGSL